MEGVTVSDKIGLSNIQVMMLTLLSDREPPRPGIYGGCIFQEVLLKAAKTFR